MNQTLVRTALKLNAAFSGISGLFLLFLPDLTGRLIGVGAPLFLQAAGLGLLIFSMDLLHQATRDKVAGWRVLYASVGDFIWVLFSIVGVILWGSHLTPQGIFAILAVAAFVLYFGLSQMAGLKKMYYQPKDRSFGYSLRYQSISDADSLWHIVGNLGAISQYAPNLASSQIESIPNDDLPLRACEDTQGNQWRERCTEYDEDRRRYEVEFLTEEAGFPYPATWMIGGWQVEQIPDGSEVIVWWKLHPKPAWLAPVIMAMLAFGVDRTFPDVIANMEKQALSRDPEELANSADQATA
ncbi:SRPBCC family protein [uncultured Marinobacter sp.]|uniref:SRPBCC family protein n=1 Tax=uncultured Marinobacter sp. TaxID=187379 RepID=UPI0025F2CFF3|nr:SRPBCC family protein [uncultured Marinobacter sp.]